MNRPIASLLSLGCCLGLLIAAECRGQTSSSYSYARLTGLNNPAAEYFGATTVRRTRQVSMPRLQVPAPRPIQVSPPSKPFSYATQGPSMSPYLSLDLPESEASLPAYYSYVKPQIDRQRLVQQQEQQMRKLQQRLRMATLPGVGATNVDGGIPTTGHSTQFMNTSSFYSVLR